MCVFMFLIDYIYTYIVILGRERERELVGLVNQVYWYWIYLEFVGYKPTNINGTWSASLHLRCPASFQRLPCSAPLTFQSVLSKMAATGLLSRNKLLQLQNKYAIVVWLVVIAKCCHMIVFTGFWLVLKTLATNNCFNYRVVWELIEFPTCENHQIPPARKKNKSQHLSPRQTNGVTIGP